MHFPFNFIKPRRGLFLDHTQVVSTAQASRGAAERIEAHHEKVSAPETVNSQPGYSCTSRMHLKMGLPRDFYGRRFRPYVLPSTVHLHELLIKSDEASSQNLAAPIPEIGSPMPPFVEHPQALKV